MTKKDTDHSKILLASLSWRLQCHLRHNMISKSKSTSESTKEKIHFLKNGMKYCLKKIPRKMILSSVVAVTFLFCYFCSCGKYICFLVADNDQIWFWDWTISGMCPLGWRRSKLRAQIFFISIPQVYIVPISMFSSFP